MKSGEKIRIDTKVKVRIQTINLRPYLYLYVNVFYLFFLSATVQEHSSDQLFPSVSALGPSVIVRGTELDPEQGEKERQEIHRENAERLAAKTHAEIMQERQELLNTMSEKITTL